MMLHISKTLALAVLLAVATAAIMANADQPLCHADGTCESPGAPAHAPQTTEELGGSIKCWACEKAIGKIAQLVKDHGCNAAAGPVNKLCNALPFGSSACKAGFKKGCPALLKLITEKASPQAMCAAIGLCDSKAIAFSQHIESLTMVPDKHAVAEQPVTMFWPCVLNPKCLWNKAKCGLCKKIAVKAVETAAKKGGCELLAGLCEAVGGGPEDPIADACATAMIAACPILQKLAGKGLPAEAICEKIHLC